MSQHDFTIDNAAGAVARADINAALQALVGLNSGATEPATKFAYQLWADTTTGTLKRRNAGNTAWIMLGPLNSTMTQAKSGTYNLTLSDFGTVIDCTGSWTLTTDTASSLGSGFYAWVKNAGSGTITIDPSGADQIDGATTYLLAPGEGVLVWCTGTALRVLGASRGRRTISVPAGAMTSRVTNGAASATVEMSSNKNNIPVKDFDKDIQEYVQFEVPSMPNDWDLGTFIFRYGWTAASGSGGVVFNCAAVCTRDDDALDVGFGTAVEVADTLIAANDYHLSSESTAITPAGTAAAGCRTQWQISRVVGAGGDNLGVDARLIGARITYGVRFGHDG